MGLDLLGWWCWWWWWWYKRCLRFFWIDGQKSGKWWTKSKWLPSMLYSFPILVAISILKITFANPPAAFTHLVARGVEDVSLSNLNLNSPLATDNLEDESGNYLQSASQNSDSRRLTTSSSSSANELDLENDYYPNPPSSDDEYSELIQAFSFDESPTTLSDAEIFHRPECTSETKSAINENDSGTIIQKRTRSTISLLSRRQKSNACPSGYQSLMKSALSHPIPGGYLRGPAYSPNTQRSAYQGQRADEETDKNPCDGVEQSNPQRLKKIHLTCGGYTAGGTHLEPEFVMNCVEGSLQLLYWLLVSLLLKGFFFCLFSRWKSTFWTPKIINTMTHHMHVL